LVQEETWMSATVAGMTTLRHSSMRHGSTRLCTAALLALTVCANRSERLGLSR
jgi:hypothetical protein